MDAQKLEQRVLAAYEAREVEGFSEDEFVDALRLATEMAADGTKPGAALIVLRTVRAAVKHEREECAKVCTNLAESLEKVVPSSSYNSGKMDSADDCAAAVRARGEA